MQLLIGETVSKRLPVSLLVFLDGGWLPWSDGKDGVYSEEDLKRKTFGTHVSVSISNIIKEFLTSDKLAYALPKLPLFQANEMKVLELLHAGDYESVSINFQDGQSEPLELAKEQSLKSKVVDILAEGSYQDIEIKSRKGIITKIEKTGRSDLS